MKKKKTEFGKIALFGKLNMNKYKHEDKRNQLLIKTNKYYLQT